MNYWQESAKRDEIDGQEEVSWCRRFLFMWCLRFELPLLCDFNVLQNDDELLLLHLCFSFLFGDLEGLFERTITPLSIEGYFSEIPIWGVRSFFLSILLSRIIW